MAVEDIAVDHAEATLQVEGREDLAAEDAGPEIRRMPATVSITRSANSSLASSQLRPSGRCGATCCTNRLATCLPAGASDVVERRGDQHLDHRLARPAAGAGIEIGAIQVGDGRTDDYAGAVMVLQVRAGPAAEVRQLGQRDVHAERAGAGLDAP